MSIENVEYVQKGFRILLSSLSGYIAQEFNRKYRGRWWDEVLNCLSDQYDLPYNGSYGELVDSLDFLNCARLLDRRWGEVFRLCLSPSCRAWVNELKGIRNIVAHLGQRDLDQPTAERALDTMVLLCNELEQDAVEEIRGLYIEVRALADGPAIAPSIQFIGVAQPMASDGHSAGGLLELVDTELVQRTELSRKVSFGGKTETYPVYKVRLDALYYNDQNDRIATWISRYEAENGNGSLSELSKDIYNRIIEDFICQSNYEAIQKTQKNISLVGQREPGVTLADGRIVDGNRRYTCLRRLQRESAEPVYFETVIMDADMQEDKKQIKLLELAIQHGEEKKVDYDLIDFAIGTYRDIVQTGLLTVEEYAQGTNETPADVRKRLQSAEIICRFLEYIKLPEQYHVAREYQVYSIFQEMQQIKLPTEQQKRQLETIVFNNTVMHAIRDQRKFIRDIKALVKGGVHDFYFAQQQELGEEFLERFNLVSIHSKKDVDEFANANTDISEELQLSMERALLRSRAQQLKTKPSENMAKCLSLMQDTDVRLFDRISIEDREQLKAQLDKIINIAEEYKRLL